MGGSAILAAATGLRDAIRARAAERMGCAPAEVALLDGRAQGPAGRSIRAGRARGRRHLVRGQLPQQEAYYAYGAHAAHVAVDLKLGHVRSSTTWRSKDCGRIINPMTLCGQVIGALVQGLGGAFLENLVYDEHGQFLTGSLADYLVPTASDFPNLRAVVLESHPSPINPLGAKGAGEGGIIPVGG